MTRLFAAGFLYFALIFVVGTILGGIRIMIVEPMAGSVAGVMLEMPIILIAAWFLCRFVVHRFDIQRNVNDRLTMGLFAFACLMAGELVLANILEGRSLIEFLQMFELPENRIGLGGQILFALFPILQLYGSATSKK